MLYLAPLVTRPLALLACALVTLLLSAAAAALAHLERAASSEERSLEARAADVKSRVARLSPMADFVQVSLLQREAIKLGKELALARAAREARVASRGASRALERLVRPAALVLLAAAFWGAPLAEGLPTDALGPGVGALLAFPGLPRGSVGVLAWLALCSAVASGVVSAAAAALGLDGADGKAEGDAAGALGMLQRFLR